MSQDERDLILLTNDDGYTAPGLRALWRALEPEFETLVVAPRRQRSWIGKAMSNPGPVELQTETVDDKQVYVIDDGLPADCTNIGLYHLCPRRPAAVISGINNGPNFTSSLVLASGTVGAALEAAENGVLGIAASLDPDLSLYRELEAAHAAEQVEIFREAAGVVKRFVCQILEKRPEPQVKLVNLIIPQRVARPLKFVQSNPLPYDYGSVFIRRDNRFYNRSVGFIREGVDILPESDVAAVQQGWVAFTAYTGRLEIARMDDNLYE
jgi:5'/3'-nucleotidase SurE